MADDVVLNKAASIERCVARALEEYEADPESFSTNFTRQDAAILNIQRACEACLDMGQTPHFFKSAAKCINRHQLGQALLQMQKKARSVHAAIVSQLKWS